MSDWNYDMSAAPTGTTRMEVRKIGKNEVEVEVHTPALIIACDQDSDVVTTSKWLPKEGRWSMFAKSRPPLAWKPWPLHPGQEAQQ